MKNNKNILNILCISDLHFGKKNDTKLSSDLQTYFIDEIPNIIEEYGNIGMIIICGDLFDRILKMNEPSSKLVIKFIEQLCELSAKYKFYLRLVKGTMSHDYSQLNNFNYFEVRYPLFKIIQKVDEEIINYNNHTVSILYLPEEYPENYDKYYSKYLKRKYDFIFGHGMIDFVAYTGNEEIKKKLKRNDAVHKAEVLDEICKYFCIFGHIHQFNNYKDMDKIMYTGSFERFTFDKSDQDEKGYLLLRADLKTDETEVYFYENENASTYEIIDLALLDFKNTEDKLKYVEQQKEKYDYIKLLVPEDEENKDLLKSVISSDIKVQINNTIKDDVLDERYRFLLERTLPINESISKYISLTFNKEIDPILISQMIAKT